VIAVDSAQTGGVTFFLDSVHDRGVKVRVIMDRSQAAGRYSMAGRLIADSIPVRIGAGKGLMHDKFAVIDDSITLTGSYNWTEAAETRNDENLLVLASRPLAEAFWQGSGDIINNSAPCREFREKLNGKRVDFYLPLCYLRWVKGTRSRTDCTFALGPRLGSVLAAIC
jgi:hypothetical protein